jgi:flagellar hook-length control protein FliK
VAGWVKSEDDASIGELDLQLNPTCEQGTPADAANAASASVGTDNARTSSAAHPLRPTLTLNSAPAFGPTKDRSTEISELADKLGQALSERLQEQVARGDWKLELRLKPAHLGKISVELGMNGGSLDALFKSDNALTRELLAQSAPRLRESLTHAGMAVANVWVNSNSQQQTGGNSTPRFYKPEVSEVTAPAEGAKVTTIQLARTKSKDGWDELA